MAKPESPYLDTVPYARATRPFFVKDVATQSLAFRHCVARPERVVERFAGGFVRLDSSLQRDRVLVMIESLYEYGNTVGRQSGSENMNRKTKLES